MPYILSLVEHESLGDILCTAAEAQAGVNAIGQLIDYWRAVGSPAQFGSAVQAIVSRGQTAASQNTALTSAVGNCAIKDAGLQAQKLMAEIGAATGKASPSPTLAHGTTSTLDTIGSLLKWGLLLGVGYVGYNLLLKRGAHG